MTRLLIKQVLRRAQGRPRALSEGQVNFLAKKLDEFNAAQESETRLGEEEVKVVLGSARGLVRLSKENLAVLMKMQRWQTSQAFPLLDILRSGVRIGRW